MSPFIKIIWEPHHQLTFTAIIARYVIHTCLSFAANKKDTEFLTT